MIALESCLKTQGVYYCEDGDTLSSIAQKFSTSKELLVKENDLKGEIKAGDYLFVRRYKKVYVVQVEDTAKTVAEKLGTTVENLFETNKITEIYPFMQVVCD